MGAYAKVLVAFDDSEPARAALDVACSLVRGDGGALIVAYVAEPHLGLVGRHVTTLAPSAGERREAVAIISSARDRAAARGLQAEVVSLDGDPVEALAVLATERAVDLLVVGSHAKRSIAEVLLGSVAAGLMAASDVPVLVVSARRAARA